MYKHLIDWNFVEYLIENIQPSQPARLISQSLRTLNLLLIYGQRTAHKNEINELAFLFQEKGGVEILDQMWDQFPNTKIWDLTIRIINDFYGLQEI